ncbi:MAG: hypothetical protein D6812_12985 [Deltaproteobacteria bacterium]|nr:MAG: hypothetical protein D6812_12985 [Deltaproteobacteria bacterium]
MKRPLQIGGDIIPVCDGQAALCLGLPAGPEESSIEKPFHERPERRGRIRYFREARPFLHPRPLGRRQRKTGPIFVNELF